jgi:DNA-binding MarR family transcriptional regulator
MEAIRNVYYIQFPIAAIDHIIKKLSGSEAKIYVLLIRHTISCGTPSCNMSFRDLASRTGLALSSVLKSVKSLEEKQLISQDHFQGNSMSTFRVSVSKIRKEESKVTYIFWAHSMTWLTFLKLFCKILC